jgi:hypothetical protein
MVSGLKKALLNAGFLGVFILLFAAPASAYTVSFIVIETGLIDDDTAAMPATMSAYLWENGLMDAFFDAGHIVSNAHTIRVDREGIKDFPDEAQADFDEAQEGGVDFFVMALLDHQGSGGDLQSPKTSAGPRQVFIKVFRVRPRQKVYEQRYSDPVKDELAKAKSAARSILPHLRDK